MYEACVHSRWAARPTTQQHVVDMWLQEHRSFGVTKRFCCMACCRCSAGCIWPFMAMTPGCLHERFCSMTGYAVAHCPAMQDDLTHIGQTMLAVRRCTFDKYF